MKQATNLTTGLKVDTVRDHLKTDYNVVAKPRLIADWNMNRYAQNVYADGIQREKDHGFDVVNFPITSIIEPLRPGKGVLKARAGQATVSSGTWNNPNEPRFYLGDGDDIYKYWTSPDVTDGSGNFPTDVSGSTCQPFVIYQPIIKANKIVVRIDNTWASPKNYSVQLATALSAGPDDALPWIASSWSTIGGASPAYDAGTGVLVLYYNGTAWVTTKPATLVLTDVAGIKLTVGGLQAGKKKDGTTMTYATAGDRGVLGHINTTGNASSFNLIAIEAHIEADFSDRIITLSDEFDFAETSQIYPVGTITSNQAELTLDNTDTVFDYENVASTYYHLLEPNVEFNLEYIYTISGTDFSVQQLKMYSENWNINDDSTVSIPLEDYSKFLKEIKPNQMMYENNPVSQCVWRVLDAIGFTDYEVQSTDLNADHIIPVFWTTGEETVWEVLNSLAEATQTAIYFDSAGQLQVKTRDQMFATGRILIDKLSHMGGNADWTLRGAPGGGFLPDIITLDETQEFEANQVNVIYKTTKWKLGTDGNPAMSVVWQPDDDLVVRSSILQETLTGASTHVFIPPAEVPTWPFTGVVEIDGEIIKYDSKYFIYYTGIDGLTLNVAEVVSQDEYTLYNEMTLPQFRYKNNFTGHLHIAERGAWNTAEVDHPIGPQVDYRTKMIINDQTAPTTYSPVTNFYAGDSKVAIISHPYMNGPNDLYFANKDTAQSTGFNMHGARIVLGVGYQQNRGGIGLRQSGVEEDGYFVELTPTNKITNRAERNEITLYSRKSRAWNVLHAGFPLPIVEGVYYDLDVSIETSGSTDTILVWVNGLLVCRKTVSGAWRQPNSGKMSLYARGKTGIGYEYFYGVVDDVISANEGGFGFYDLQYGGVRGGAWERAQVWQIGYRYKRINKDRPGVVPFKKNIYFFDDFGPYVHEVREFDVKLDPNPVQYSQLYSSNEWYAAVVEYFASPFESHFVIANTSRQNAVLQGSDTLIFSGSTVEINQVCAVLGRDLVINDDEKITVKSDASIRKRGLIEVDLTSNWLQSKDMAQSVGDWIVAHWGQGVDEIEVEVFGNPLLEIGDIINIDFPVRHMAISTHSYFLTGTKNEFNNGISTTLTLRRIR